jgi:hypothetical protein
VKYFLEINDGKKIITWEVKLKEEPSMIGNQMPLFKETQRRFGPIRGYKCEDIEITFIENFDEKNLFRRELIFEKTLTSSKKPRRDSEFLLTLSRFHLFVGGNIRQYGGSLTNVDFSLIKVDNFHNIVKKWILKNITIIDASFTFSSFISSMENQKLIIAPESFWVVAN